MTRSQCVNGTNLDCSELKSPLKQKRSFPTASREGIGFPHVNPDDGWNNKALIVTLATTEVAQLMRIFMMDGSLPEVP